MRTRLALATALCVAVAAALGAAVATGGTPPKRADRNLGWVLNKPQLHNLLWDSDWDVHNTVSKAQIHTFSKKLAGGTWISHAAGYGIKSLALVETRTPGGACAKRPGSTVSTVAVLGWVSCMILPGTGVKLPVPRLPVSNDLYVVYLPKGTRIIDNLTLPSVTVLGRTIGGQTIVNRSSCDDYGAYHAFSLYLGGLYPIAIVPADCASSLDDLTRAASHEIIEAATDPIPGAGWIDTSIPNAAPAYRRLSEGEVADICSSAGAVPASSVTRGGFQVAAYWSNADGACIG